MALPVSEIPNISNDDESKARPIVYVNSFLRTLPKIISKQRYLAYASEVGESFRPIVPKYIINTAYAASILYVCFDVGMHTENLIKQNKSRKEVIVLTSDKILWHSFASMILPAITVHSIVKYSSIGIHKYNMFNNYPKVKGWAPTVFALMCIPFIIHPIDHVTDFAMDNTIRKLYNRS